MDSNFLFETDRPWLVWEGTVAPRESWPRTEEGVTSPNELSNWGHRVRVRIDYVHPKDKKILPDGQLPWVEVPGSFLGTGQGGMGASSGVTQGSRVWGIWTSPSTRTGPIMMGVKSNNDQTKLSKSQPVNDGFAALSGYTAKDIVATYDMPLAQGLPLESIAYPNLWGLGDKEKLEEAKFSLPSPSDCEKIPLKGIQLSIQNLIQDVEKAQRQLSQWQSAAQGWIAEKQAYIQGKIQKVSKFISQGLKWVFEEIRKYIMEQINDKTKKLYFLVNPPDRDKVKGAQDTVVELIACLFNKLIKNLFGLVGNFLKGAIDRFVNVPQCAIENFIGSLIGNLLGFISGAVDKILGGISSILGSAFSLADSILGLLKAILGFFLCEEKQDCPETTEWDIFKGGKPGTTFNFDSIFNSAKNVASTVSSTVSDVGSLNLNFSDLFNNAAQAFNACNVGPVFCAPPKVTFWGGGGSGATGNVIVSAVGDILGVDVITQGGGYKKAPFVTFEDNCGKGKGGRGKALIEKDGGTDPDTGEPTYKVTNVVIEEEGYDFLPTPNGDLGGDGRTWATSDQTIVIRNDGSYDQPYNPGDEIPNLQPGDTVIRPEDRVIIGSIGAGSTNVGTGNTTGIGIDIGTGIGNTTGGFPSGGTRTISLPGTGPSGATDFNAFPIVNIGSYPALLYLCGIDIENSGINYSKNDKIVIENNTGGAVLEPVFGPFGVLEKVKIVNSGNGFTERPTIYIESETGYNAILHPIFCVNRIGDDTEGKVPPDAKFVTVIDCVGRI